MKQEPTTSSDVAGVPGPQDDPGKEMAAPSAMNADQLTSVTGVHLMQGIGHRPAEGFWTEAWRQVFKRPGAVAGIVWVGLIAFFAVFAPLVANGHPILLVDQADVSPLGTLLGGLGEAISSFDGARLAIFTFVWIAAWVMAPKRMPLPVLGVLAGLATIVFGLRIFAQFFAGPAGEQVNESVFRFTRFLLGEGKNPQTPSHAFQIIVDLAATAGLVWAAGAFQLSRRVRIATAPVIAVAAIGSLLGMAGTHTGVRSPMLQFLTVVDLTLLLGAIAALVLIVPKWWGPRSERAKVLLTVSLQAGLTMLVHAIFSGMAANRDASEWLRSFEQMPRFEVLASILIASVVGGLFVFAHPLTKLSNRAGVSLLVGLGMFGLMAARWSTPLPNFNYVAQETRGEVSATYTIIPWSPQQGGTAVDLLPPDSNVYSQVLPGLVQVDLADRARDTGVLVKNMPLDAEVMQAIEARLGFARSTLPADPQVAMSALREELQARPDMTVEQAVEFFETLPGPAYSLGTDSLGQDMLSQLLHACRLSISIGLVSTAIAVVIGVTVGALMGYFGGWVDMMLYRVVEIFMAIPLLFLLIVAAAVLPRNTYVMMAIIGCVTWTGSARFIRAEFYKLRGQDFVQSARAVGLPLRSVLFKHMLPNGVTPVLVDASFAIAAAILAEAVLSYLGLGPANQASWGRLLSDANNQVGKFMWWLAIFPGFAIFLTVLSYNLIGEALRDAIDPKLKKARV
ncbi:MAG: ABC transporter permease [Phycisphaerales bacterium JB064]